MRNSNIIKVSLVGIIANIVLALAKGFIGLLSGSIAITLDALNNLSDVLSSVVTIIGTKIAGKKPDRQHPMGHGRIEYISAAIISMIIIYAGGTALYEAVKKILEPSKPQYEVYSLLIIGMAVLVKIALGKYVEKKGHELNSGALVASGKDALFDAVISTSTLVAAIIYIFFEISLESYLGVIISLFIIKSGWDMLMETLSQIIGERVEGELSSEVKEAIMEFPDVYGAYDLILHNYGPNLLIGSVHIEVPDVYTVDKLDKLERDIVDRVYEKSGVVMAGISVYSYNTKDENAGKVHSHIRKLVMEHKDVLQMHGFYVDVEEKLIRFDIIIDYKTEDREALYNHIIDDVQKAYPKYSVRVTLDDDISD